MSRFLEFIPARSRKRIFLTLLALTLILFGAINRLSAPLINQTVAPSGIVSFELASTSEKAEVILKSWDANARLFAAFGLGLDYLLLTAYGLTLSLGVLMAGKKQGGKFEKFSHLVAWGALLAALSDAFENYFLWQILIGAETDIFPRLAASFAQIKFALIFISLGFAVTGWLWKK